MTNADPYDSFDPPPPSEYFPSVQWNNPGTWIQGTLSAVRVFQSKQVGDDAKKPAYDIQVISCSPGATAKLGSEAQGNVEYQPIQPGMQVSVICGPASLWDQALALRPQPGAVVTIHFTGFGPNGQSKTFILEAGGAAPAAPQPAAPAPQQVPQVPAAVPQQVPQVPAAVPTAPQPVPPPPVAAPPVPPQVAQPVPPTPVPVPAQDEEW